MGRPRTLVLSISDYAVEGIKEFEGFRARSYDDPLAAGVWTIGYGETEGVKEGDVTTEKEAESRLESRLQRLFTQLNRCVLTRLEQGQSDALYSLVYNVGIGAFLKSKLCVKINKQDRNAPNEFLDWCHDRKGNEIAGLKKRRVWEYRRFLLSPWPPGEVKKELLSTSPISFLEV